MVNKLPPNTLFGQGSTEYLVVLGTVLTISLISVALLGGFPGYASDSREAQSKSYWQSSSPISIVESAARLDSNHGFPITLPYFRLRNTGNYPIRIVAIYSDGYKISMVWRDGDTDFNRTFSDYQNISERLYLNPGEDGYLGHRRDGTGASVFPNLPYAHGIVFCDSQCNGSWQIPQVNCSCYGSYWGTNYWADVLYNAGSMCKNTAPQYGTIAMKNFGFEYIEYIEGQELTKLQVAPVPLVIKCSDPVVSS